VEINKKIGTFPYITCTFPMIAASATPTGMYKRKWYLENCAQNFQNISEISL